MDSKEKKKVNSLEKKKHYENIKIVCKQMQN